MRTLHHAARPTWHSHTRGRNAGQIAARGMGERRVSPMNLGREIVIIVVDANGKSIERVTFAVVLTLRSR